MESSQNSDIPIPTEPLVNRGVKKPTIWKKAKSRQVVPIDQIPKKEDIRDVPTESPIGVYRLCQEMEGICERERGVGLAAVQIGIPWRLFIVKSENDKFTKRGLYGYFLNCEYEPLTDERVVSLEGCLSVRSPDGRRRNFQVERYADIRLKGTQLTILNNALRFIPVDVEIHFDEQSVVFQHEIDHQHSILINDIGKEVFVYQ
jgi:peptide deformylase